jgi:hypothetical protein
MQGSFTDLLLQLSTTATAGIFAVVGQQRSLLLAVACKHIRVPGSVAWSLHLGCSSRTIALIGRT